MGLVQKPFNGDIGKPSKSRMIALVKTELEKTPGEIVLLFVTTYVVVRYRQGIKWSLLAILTSPLILFAAFVPRWRDFFTVNARLVGAKNDPNYLATFLALGLLIAAVYFLYTNSSKRWAGVAYIALFSPLFLWAYSRAAFLSVAIALVILLVLYFLEERSLVRARFAGILCGVFILFTAFSFFVLPNETQFLIYRRSIAPVFPSIELRGFMANWISEGDAGLRTAILEDAPTDTFDLSRGSLWKDALGKAAISPLGLGPAYHNWNSVGNIGRPHNTFLEVVLTAGWGGLMAFLAFLYFVARGTVRLLRRPDFTGVALAIGFIYLLLSGMFLDMFTLRWLWLIMGMIAGYTFLIGNEESQSINNPARL